MQGIDIKKIIDLLNKAIEENNYNLVCDGESIALYEYTDKILNYIEKNDNETTRKFNSLCNRHKIYFKNSINELRKFIEENENIDTPQKMNDFLKLVPFSGHYYSDKNYCAFLRCLGFGIVYDQDFHKFIPKILMNYENWDEYYFYKGRIEKSYNMKLYSSYRKFRSKEELIDSYRSTRFANLNGEALSQESTLLIVTKIVDYMGKQNLVYSKKIVNMLKNSLFRSIFEEEFKNEGISIDTQSLPNQDNALNENNQDKANEDSEDNIYQETYDDKVDEGSGKRHQSDSYIRDSKVVQETKERAKDSKGLYHCELCDYDIKVLENKLENILDNATGYEIGLLTGRIEEKIEASRSFDSGYFHSHHIMYLQNGGPDKKYNTICLCRRCHAKIHNDIDFIKKYEPIEIAILEKHLKEENSELLPKFYNLFSDTDKKVNQR